jgi:hypothetical protein
LVAHDIDRRTIEMNHIIVFIRLGAEEVQGGVFCTLFALCITQDWQKYQEQEAQFRDF